MTSDCRAKAARIILAVVAKGQSLNTLLPPALEKCPDKDRALLRLLCYGSLRYFFRYRACLDVLMDKPLKPRDHDILALLVIGCFQLEHTRIPPYAAINSCVDASKQLGKIWAKGLINAVLRNFQRRRQALDEQLAANPSYRYAHPAWLLQRLSADWPEQAGHILQANNQPAPMTLRVNRQKTGREAYLEQLLAAGIEARPCRFSESGIQLGSPVDISQLPGFDQGLCSVQDEAAQLAAELLAPSSSDRVLDACCAPGGKTGHLLEAGVAEDNLVALDVSAARLSDVRDNLNRLGYAPRLLEADAEKPQDWWDGKPFQRILLDAPCSASGVIRRHPDIKLLRQESDISPLAVRQGKLLDALWQTLEPGGILLYATCSVLTEENRDVVSAFLARTGDAMADTIIAEWGQASGKGRQLLPVVDGHDGFFYARLKKARG